MRMAVVRVRGWRRGVGGEPVGYMVVLAVSIVAAVVGVYLATGLFSGHAHSGYREIIARASGGGVVSRATIITDPDRWEAYYVVRAQDSAGGSVSLNVTITCTYTDGAELTIISGFRIVLVPGAEFVSKAQIPSREAYPAVCRLVVDEGSEGIVYSVAG